MPPKPHIRILRPPSSGNVERPRPAMYKPTHRAIPQTRPQSASPPPPKANVVPILKGAAMSLATGVLFQHNFLSLDHVNGSSMAPTLSPHAHETGQKDRILIQRHMVHNGKVQRGEIVTFWKPHKPGEISIKRIIALEGDTVYPHRGYALDPDVVRMDRVQTWDGLPVRDPDAIRGDELEVGKVVVPQGHMWVEGDNWRQSYDSCDFGPVSLGLLDGKATKVWRRWWTMDDVGDGRKWEKGHVSRVVPKGDDHAKHAR